MKCRYYSWLNSACHVHRLLYALYSADIFPDLPWVGNPWIKGYRNRDLCHAISPCGLRRWLLAVLMFHRSCHRHSCDSDTVALFSQQCCLAVVARRSWRLRRRRSAPGRRHGSLGQRGRAAPCCSRQWHSLTAAHNTTMDHYCSIWTLVAVTLTVHRHITAVPWSLVPLFHCCTQHKDCNLWTFVAGHKQ